MISVDTPPGTDVIALLTIAPTHGLPGIRRGGLYTVARIRPVTLAWAEKTGRSACVELAGHGVGVSYRPPLFGLAFLCCGPPIYWAYPLAAFRYLDLGPLAALLDQKEQSPCQEK